MNAALPMPQCRALGGDLKPKGWRGCCGLGQSALRARRRPPSFNFGATEEMEKSRQGGGMGVHRYALENPGFKVPGLAGCFFCRMGSMAVNAVCPFCL
jgi:hypothetical protein